MFILADDLSGALEAGAAFRSRGWRVVLPLQKGVREMPPGAVTVLTTESRNASDAEAAAAVRRALAVVSRAGGRLLCKKIDSTLRGAIGAELEPILAGDNAPPVLFCPANPRAGRTVRNGVLHVHGVPLEQTDFREDPLRPATSGNIAALLGRQGVSAGRLHTTVQGGSGPGRIVIPDAESMDDLRRIVAEARAAAPETVFVGSGAVAVVLAECLPALGDRAEAAPPRLESLLVLCASRHPVSRRQMDWWSEKAGWPRFDVNVAEAPVEETVRTITGGLARSAVLAVRFHHAGQGREATVLAAEVMRFVEQVARALPTAGMPGGLFLTGGETAWAVCQAMGGVELEVEGELEPGVALARLRGAPGTPFVVTKPGGFGADDSLVRAAGRLVRPDRL